MLKAGALLYAVFISFLIFLFASLIVLMLDYSHRDREINQSGIESVLYLRSVADSICNLSDFSGRMHEKIKATNNSVFLEVANWGVFNLLSVSDERYPERKQIALAGSSCDDLKFSFISDHTDIIWLSGTSMITGQCILPEKGIKPSRRNSYLHQGPMGDVISINRGSVSLNNRVNYDTVLTSIDGDTMIEFVHSERKVFQKFGDKTLYLIAQRELLLDEDSLIGNIIIRSSISIHVSRNCFLKDVILVAPEIVFENNFNGCLQAIAEDSIIVGQNVKLLYPSALTLIPKCENKGALMQLNMGSEISGALLCLNPTNCIYNRMPLIKIPVECNINGYIFNSGETDLEGTLNGVLLTDYLVHITPAEVLINYLHNGKIIPERLPSGMAFPGILTGSKPEIIKWLN